MLDKVFSKEEIYDRRLLLQRRLSISGRVEPQGRQIAQKITQKLLREFVSKLSTKKYKRHSRPLRGRLLPQGAVGALGCFSVDKEETTIYKGNAFQQAIFELYPIVSAVTRSDVVKQALHLCAKPASRGAEELLSTVSVAFEDICPDAKLIFQP